MTNHTISKRRKYKMGIALLLVLLVFFVFLIRADHSNTLTVGIFYGSGWGVPGSEYYDIVEEAIAEFQKMNPGTKVTYVKGIPVDDYSEWLSGKILKGTQPDVYFVFSEDFNDFVSLGALKPLNNFMEKDESFDETVFYPSACQSGVFEEKQYALPFESNPMMMFVNKTLLKSSGLKEPARDWDWDAFYDICDKVTKDQDGDGTIDQYGVYNYQWSHAVVSNGLLPFDEKGTQTNVLEEDFVKSLEFVKKLENLHPNYEIRSEDFDLGSVAFMPLSFAEYRTYMPYPWRIKKYSGFEWNAISMPAGPDGGNVSSVDTLMVGISSKTRNEKKAWEFAKLLTTDEKIQSLIYEHTSGVSPLKSVTTSENTMELLNRDTPGESNIDMTLLDAVMENAVSAVHFKNYNDVYNTLDGYLKEYIQSDADTSVGLYNIKSDIQKMLE